MTTHTQVVDRGLPRLSTGRVGLTLAAAVIVAVGVNALVARAAVGLGAHAGFMPLTLPLYGSFTLVGIVVGWIGWRLVRRHAERPGRVLAWLVPVVGVVSFVPDVLLGTLRFIPDATWGGVAGLMTMHVVVIVVAVCAYVLADRVASTPAA